MTGHAFQMLVSDDELRRSLRAIRAALADGGRFAFETRHPQARAGRAGTARTRYGTPTGTSSTVTYEVHDGPATSSVSARR